MKLVVMDETEVLDFLGVAGAGAEEDLVRSSVVSLAEEAVAFLGFHRDEGEELVLGWEVQEAQTPSVDLGPLASWAVVGVEEALDWQYLNQTLRDYVLVGLVQPTARIYRHLQSVEVL